MITRPNVFGTSRSATQRINGLAVDAHFPVEVRAGAVTCRANRGDFLSDFYVLSIAHIKFGTVTVQSRYSLSVIKNYAVSISATITSKNNAASTSGFYRRAS